MLQQGEVKASPPTASKDSGARIAYEIIRLEPRPLVIRLIGVSKTVKRLMIPF